MTPKLDFYKYIKLLKQSGLKPKFNSIARMYGLKPKEVKFAYDIIDCKVLSSKYCDQYKNRIINYFEKGYTPEQVTFHILYSTYRGNADEKEIYDYVNKLKKYYDKLTINDYYKLDVVVDDTKNKLTRTLLVKKNMNLFDVATSILESFDALFYHQIEIEDELYKYVSEYLVEEDFPTKKEWLNYAKYKIKDLNLSETNSFTLWYDFGCDWKFNCSLTDGIVTLDSKDDAIVLDGHGLRIWEDNKSLLLDYIDGNLTDEDMESYYIDEECKAYYLDQVDELPDIKKINKKLKHIIGKYYEGYGV